MGVALMEDETPEVLQARLSSYKEQLEQIDAVLLADPTNDTLAKLRGDIVQVIQLTSELLAVTLSGALGNDADAKDLLKDYEAGDIVMAYFEKDNNFQPAEIDAVTSEGNFAITWLGFPSSSSEVMPDKIKAFEGNNFQVGEKALAIFSGDQLWYEVTIGRTLDDGYDVTFDKFGNSERVSKTHVKAKQESKEEKKRKLQIREIPDTLKVMPTDTDAVKAQKKKKIKQIKSHNRSVEKDLLQNRRQNNWHSFQSKGAKRKVIGKFVGRHKESMFKTPEGDTGKVGVIGSGRPMTEFEDFQERSRHRAGVGEDEDDF